MTHKVNTEGYPRGRKGAVLKTVWRSASQEFESLTLRHNLSENSCAASVFGFFVCIGQSEIPLISYNSIFLATKKIQIKIPSTF